MQSNDIPKNDPEHEEWLKSVQMRLAQADLEDAPLFAKQMAERDLIDAGEIDTSKGEYLARFDLSGGRIVCEIFRPSQPVERVESSVRVEKDASSKDAGGVPGVPEAVPPSRSTASVKTGSATKEQEPVVAAVVPSPPPQSPPTTQSEHQNRVEASRTRKSHIVQGRHELLGPYIGADELTQFAALCTRNFSHDFAKINAHSQEEFMACMADVLNVESWKRRNVRKPFTHSGSSRLRIAHVNKTWRMLFEGPLESEYFAKPVLLFRELVSAQGLSRLVARMPSVSLEETMELEAQDTEVNGTFLEDLSITDRAFAHFIPAAHFADHDHFHAALVNEQGFNPTEHQVVALSTPRPFVIHGMAGSGKTTILCHRVAASVKRSVATGLTDSMLYLAYSRGLVDHAKKVVSGVLDQIHYVSGENTAFVSFLSFDAFLAQYIDDARIRAELLHEETDDGARRKDNRSIVRRITFSRFRRVYESKFSRSGKSPSAEVAWHAIRSLLKGACLPQLDDRDQVAASSRPPLSRERYEEIARRRREFEPSKYEQLYDIGRWYQQYLADNDCWDDQDIAWSALAWVMREQRRNANMRLYSEVYCDEVQDLTELEFKLLLSVCRPPLPYSGEGINLALAGDPLQTINPTGFRWDTTSAHVYQVNREPVARIQLFENYRTDERILAVANAVQRVRATVLQEELPDQKGFDKGGTAPVVLIGGTEIDEVLREFGRSV